MPDPDPTLNIPTYWIRPTQILSGAQGMHRFLWDMHYTPLSGVSPEYPIAAVYRNTAPEPTSPWAMPGKYTVVLTIGGKSYEQPLSIRMDPRVKTSNADLAEQFKISKRLYDERRSLLPVSESVKKIQAQVAALQKQTTTVGALKPLYDALAEKLQKFSSGPATTQPGPAVTAQATLTTTLGRLKTLFDLLQGVDLAPTPQAAADAATLLNDSRLLEESWQAIKSQDIAAMNEELRAAGLAQLDFAK